MPQWGTVAGNCMRSLLSACSLCSSYSPPPERARPPLLCLLPALPILHRTGGTALHLSSSSRSLPCLLCIMLTAAAAAAFVAAPPKTPIRGLARDRAYRCRGREYRTHQEDRSETSDRGRSGRIHSGECRRIHNARHEDAAPVREDSGIAAKTCGQPG